MASSGRSFQAVVERLMVVFREHGYDGASLSRLAEETQLSRSSLYHHFPRGKEDMARVVLETAIATLNADVIAPLCTPGEPEVRLRSAAAGLARFFGQNGQGSLIELFSIGEAGRAFQPLIARKADMLCAAFATLAIEGGADPATAQRRGEDLLIAIEGALVVGRVRGDFAVFRRVLEEMPERLFGKAVAIGHA